MKTVSQNGILEEKEFGEFKARTVKLRFMQQISYGVGAAMVFGLISALALKLAPLAWGTSAGIAANGAVIAATAASVPAMIGLAAIAIAGISCIYLSAKFLSESTLMEQDFQAKKIGAATRGVAPEQEPEGRVQQFPQQSQATMPDQAEAAPAAQEITNQPTLVVNNATLDGRVAANDIAFARAHA